MPAAGGRFLKGINTLVLLMLGLSLIACTSDPMKVDHKFSQLNQYEETRYNNLEDKWWLTFGDETLNKLVIIGLENNQSLISNLQRLKSTEQVLFATQSQDYPDLRLTTRATSNIENPTDITSDSIALSSSWELDMFGRLTAIENRAKWNLIARQALYKARANVVAGTIATIWFNWLTEVNKRELLAEQYSRTNTALTIISRRFSMGKNSVTDIWQQKRLLASITVRQSDNEARLMILKKQLILWLGITENELPKLAGMLLPELVPFPEQGIALKSIEQRPDIQQAFANLQVQDANLASAVAARLPRLTLSGSYSTDVSEMFSDWAGSLTASLALPLFNAGELNARKKQQELLLSAEYADYKQTWLDAIYAVETTIIDEQRLASSLTQTKQQLVLAQHTDKHMALKYVNGKSNYIALLRAQETVLNLERQVLEAQRTLINNRISLYRELSHGNFNQEQSLPSITILTE